MNFILNQVIRIDIAILLIEKVVTLLQIREH